MEQWSDKYLLGINEIDEQHRGFFELCNHKPLSEMDRAEMALMLEQLNDYIQNHFRQAFFQKLFHSPQLKSCR